jgi:aconitate decarboxylase
MAAVPLHAQGSLPSVPESPTGRLCQWIASVSRQDVPDELLTRIKYLMLDGIACALVGAHLPWSEKATQAFLDMEPEGTSLIIGHNKVLVYFRLCV